MTGGSGAGSKIFPPNTFNHDRPADPLWAVVRRNSLCQCTERRSGEPAVRHFYWALISDKCGCAEGVKILEEVLDVIDHPGTDCVRAEQRNACPNRTTHAATAIQEKIGPGTRPRKRCTQRGTIYSPVHARAGGGRSSEVNRQFRTVECA